MKGTSTSTYLIDLPALWQTVDTVRRKRGLLWTDVYEATGLSRSFYSRLRTSHKATPTVGGDSLISVMVWLGVLPTTGDGAETKVADFVRRRVTE